MPATNLLLPASAVTTACPVPPVSVSELAPMNLIWAVPVPRVTAVTLPLLSTKVSPPTV